MWTIKYTLSQRLIHFFFRKHIPLKWTDGKVRCGICDKVLECEPDNPNEVMGVAGEGLTLGDPVTIGNDGKIYKAKVDELHGYIFICDAGSQEKNKEGS